ncbi:MAG: Type secretion system protein virB3 [Pseudomonadota bacterium]|jgi:type IV secretion system protein VirB3
MREAIYKGATRPAIVAGVPLLPALGLIGLGGVLGAWGAFLLSAWCLVGAAAVVIPGIAWMRAVTRRDDQRVRQFWLQWLLLRRHPNRRLWRCRSYAPLTHLTALAYQTCQTDRKHRDA